MGRAMDSLSKALVGLLLVIGLSANRCPGGALASSLVEARRGESAAANLMLALADDQAPAPPVVPAATTAPSGQLSDQERETGLQVLTMFAAPMKAMKKPDDDIRKALATKAVDFLKAAIDLPDTANLTQDQQTLADSLVTGALARLAPSGGTVPTPPVPRLGPTEQPAATPATDAAPSRVLPTEVPIIYRFAQAGYTAFKADSSLDDTARKAQLRPLIATTFSSALDVDAASKLNAAEHALGQADERRYAWSPGKAAGDLEKLDSRLTPDLISQLNQAIAAKDGELKLEGSTPGTPNHLRQLQEFGESEAKSRAKITDNLTSTETKQITALVNRTLTPDEIRDAFRKASLVAPATRPDPAGGGSGKLTSDLRDRIVNLLRQINKALAPLGFDSNARKSVLTKFLGEKFANVATEAAPLIDQVIRDGPATTTNTNTNNQMQMPVATFVQPGGAPVYYIVAPPHCFLGR